MRVSVQDLQRHSCFLVTARFSTGGWVRVFSSFNLDRRRDCALPILLAWLIMISPEDESDAESEREVPPGANIYIADQAR
jgi:hypothetical protein